MSNHRQETLQELEAVLNDQEGLSDAGRAAVMREVREALSRADAGPQQDVLDVGQLRATWVQMIDDLGADLDASEREALVRSVEQALEPLRSERVQDAVEYERRRRSEGEAAAAEWLSERNKQRRSAASASLASLPGGIVPKARRGARDRRR